MASGFATAVDGFQQVGWSGLKICWHWNHLVSVNTPSPVSWREVFSTPLLNLMVYTKAVVPGGCRCRGQTTGMNAGCTSWDLFVEYLHSEVIEGLFWLSPVQCNQDFLTCINNINRSGSWGVEYGRLLSEIGTRLCHFQCTGFPYTMYAGSCIAAQYGMDKQNVVTHLLTQSLL